MSEDRGKALQELQAIYADVSEWLRFAEAKHAGLFAVWTAILIAVISIDSFFDRITMEKALLLIIILVGIMIDLISFLPFLNRDARIRRWCYKEYKRYSGNSLFYQSIFVDTYSESGDSIHKYKTILAGKGLELENSELEKDYLKQIVEVSTVGTIKVYLFRVAAQYTFFIIIMLMISIIIA